MGKIYKDKLFNILELKRRHREMKFKDIIIWVGIFVIGSLIVNFLVFPESFDNFKQNINSLKWDGLSKKQINYYEVGVLSDFSIDRCSVIEALAEQDGTSQKSKKKKLCTYYCGNKNMDYGYYECIVDRFHCYCVRR